MATLQQDPNPELVDAIMRDGTAAFDRPLPSLPPQKPFIEEHGKKLLILGFIAVTLLLSWWFGPYRGLLISTSGTLMVLGLICAVAIDIAIGIGIAANCIIVNFFGGHVDDKWIVEVRFNQAFFAFSMYLLISFLGFSLIFAGMMDTMVSWTGATGIAFTPFAGAAYWWSYRRHSKLQDHYAGIW